MSGFANAVVGGVGKLIRDWIQSTDFIAGVQGWQIAKDGSAQFNDITALGQIQVEDGSGNTIAGIDSLGNVTGQTIYANTDVILAGQSLLAELAALPQGCIAEGQIAQSNLPYPATPVNTEQPLFELDAVLTGGRIYQITVEAVKIALSTASRFQVTGRFTTDGSTPTTSSAILFQSASNHDGNEDFNVWSPSVVHMETPATTLTYRIIVTASTVGTVAADGKATWQVVGVITGNEMRTMINDMGPDPGDTSIWLGGGSGGGGTPKNFTKNYTCVHTYAYEGVNGDSSPNPGFSPGALMNTDGSAFQGDDQLGDNGNTSTMITWPGGVVTDLTGATVTSITLTLNNRHSWFDSGLSVAIGKHNGSAGGGSRPTYTDPDLVEGSMSEGGTKTFSLNSQLTAFTAALVNGEPFVLYHAGSSRNYYGYFAGASQNNPPFITVKYTK